MCNSRQTFHTSWKDRRPHRIRGPMKEKLGCRPAHTALARPHSTTRLEFGSTPRGIRLQACVWDVFTPAHQRVGLSDTSQFRPQAEGSVKSRGEFPPLFPPRKELARIPLVTARCQTCNLPFHRRQFHTPDASGLPGTKNARDGCALKRVHLHHFIDSTPQKRCKFRVRHKMKRAGQVITRDRLGPSLPRDGYVLKNLITLCGDRPTAGHEWNRSQFLFQMQSFQNFFRLCGKRETELHKAAPGSLPANHRYFGPVLFQIRRHCQQQWPRASYDDPFTLNGQTALDHGLQSTRSHHVGQRPSREGQKFLSSTSREDQLVVLKLTDSLGALRKKNSYFWLIEHA